MASINKLAVRGIRSFSPEDEEQVIEFLFPVTVIVGSNGCGKTTIIESLKYAVTGALPPGKNPGQSFVHDPKSVGSPTVKANIKLRFTNRAGNSMVCVRSMELKQTKKSMTFKTLDGMIRTTDPNTGEKLSMSHKCTELDRQLPVLLGVSKPILEHVVFCHQEDSSWPLMDSAVLKKRFDDIFDSTRYAKALKNIAEIKKEYSSKVKDLRADVEGFKSHRHAAKSFRAELEEQNAQLEELEDEINGCEDEIRKTEKILKEKKDVIDKVEDIRTDLDDRKTELHREESVLEKQREMLEEDLTEKHTPRELKDMLRDHEDQTASIQEKKEELERQKGKLKAGIEEVRKEQYDLQGQIGKLEAEKEAHESLLRQRLQKMEEISQKYSIDLTISQSQGGSLTQDSTVTATQDGSVVTISEDELKSFEQTLERKREELSDKLKEERARAQGEQDKIQGELNTFEAKARALEMKRKENQDEIRSVQTELRDLKSQGQSGRIKPKDITDLKRQVAAAAKSRDEKMNDPRKNEIPVSIRSNEEKIRNLQGEIDELSILLRELRSNSEKQSELNMLREQVDKELEALGETFQEHSYDLQRFNFETPDVPKENDDRGDLLVNRVAAFADLVGAKFETENLKLTKSQNEIGSKERMSSQQDGTLKSARSSLVKKKSEADLLSSEDGSVARFRRIARALKQSEINRRSAGVQNFKDDDPTDVLRYLESRIKQLDDGGDAGPQSAAVVENVMKRLRRLSIVKDKSGEGISKLTCPCCGRDFQDEEETKQFRSLIKELMDPDASPLIRTSDEDRERASRRKNYETWRSSISAIQSDVNLHKKLLVEIGELEKTMSESESNIRRLRGEVEKMQEDHEDQKELVNDLRTLRGTVNGWLVEAKRISDKKSELDDKKNSFTMTMSFMGDGNQDLRTVETDLDRKRDEKDMLQNEIGKLNKELSHLNNNISSLAAQVQRMDNLLKEREEKFKDEQKANSRRHELSERLEKMSGLDNEIQREIQPLKPKIRAKETEKMRAREYAKEEEDRLSHSVNVFTGEMKDLRSISVQIERTRSSVGSNSLDRLSQRIKDLKTKMSTKGAQLDKLEPELETATRSVNDQDRHRKLLTENLELIQARGRTTSLEKEIQELEEELEKIEGFDTVEQEYHKAAAEKKALFEKKARHEGRRGGFRDQIMHLKRKLKAREYKDVDEQYRKATIKMTTTQTAVSDLDKYASALDRALLRYHGIKIEEINKIIRELWLLTYKGEDITSIKLVSSPEERAKKSYNYRVVMTKGSTELDMRGRCSAGQRVLASLVIRLALAETFCVNCGCIALDEPTVNLDYRNKSGLAAALARIIASRAQQRNFQLVVITHDEDFVSMMKGALVGQTGFSMPEKFFQVRREESEADGKYYSKIDTVDWAEID